MELKVATRNVLGKNVRFLRRLGITPVHVIGHGIESESLQCDSAELQHVLSEAGTSSLIGLKVDKERKARNVVVREVQKDPQTGKVLHVDFYQVRMTEKIKIDVPVVLVGEASALRTKGTMLIQDLNNLVIECLPDDIPASIEVNLEPIAEPEQAIYVKDIVLGEGIDVLDDPDHIVVRVSMSRVEKAEVAEEEGAVVSEGAESSEAETVSKEEPAAAE